VVGHLCLIAGGVFGLIVALAHGYLRQALANVRLMLTHWRVFGFQPIAGLTLLARRRLGWPMRFPS
jgi:hypothetical protein